MRKLTVQAVETRAWAVLSVDMLPKVCKGSHVFHAWLGCARVIETSEVRGLWGKLTDRISRMHVRRSSHRGSAALSSMSVLRRRDGRTSRSAFPQTTGSRFGGLRLRQSGATLAQEAVARATPI